MIERLQEFVRRATRPLWPSRADRASSRDDADGLTTLEGTTSQPRATDIGRFRRERRRLLRAREQSVRDLGGLTLEMVRRGVFKPDLLKRRARDILGLEASVHDVEDALAAAENSIPAPGIGATRPCACGAVNDATAAFCGSCGRSLTPASGDFRCGHCATTLPGDARFCPACGTATEVTHESPTGAGW